MNSKIIRIALNIVIVFFVGQARADKKCYKPSTPQQLQAAINEAQDTTFVKGVPTILLLCAGTEVQFKKGDPRITYKDIGAGNSFVMRCESYAMSHGAPCIIDGGGGREEGESIDGLGIIKPADNSDRRLYVGSIGFLEINQDDASLFFEGLVIKSFAVSEEIGAIGISGKNSYIYFYKCIFSENNAKGRGAGAIALYGGYLFVEFKECNFNLNVVNNIKGVGGAIYTGGSVELKLESCLFKENIASFGGAIFREVDGKPLKFEMNRVAFVNNVAIEGGGIHMKNTFCYWYDVDFEGNEATQNGDGYLAEDRIRMEGSKIDLHKDTTVTWCNIERKYIVD